MTGDNNSKLVAKNLVRPSASIPWDISVIDRLPEEVKNAVKEEKVIVVASCGASHAVASSNGRITVWIASSSAPTSASNTITNQHKTHILYHPLLKQHSTTSTKAPTSSSNANSDPLLVEVIQDDESNLYVYCLNVRNGFMAAWSLSMDERSSLLPKTPSAKLKLPKSNDGSSSTTTGITCWSVVTPTKLHLGTALGQVHRIVLTLRPMTLTAELNVTRTTTTTSTLWRRLGLSSGSSSSGGNASTDTAMEFMLNKFSINASGLLEDWNATAATTSSSVKPSHAIVCDIGFLIQQFCVKNETFTFESFAILKASITSSSTLTTNNNDLYIDLICKLSRRIYYVRLDVSTMRQSSVQECIITCRWLNRFHDTVTCLKVLSSNDDIPYAFFTYPSAPVTVLALNSEITTIHEVDLPSTEAPHIVGVTRDMETHGCRLFTSTGLVLRVRWMQLQGKTPSASSGTSAKSVDEAQAHILSRHLLSAFWHFYPSTMTSNTIPSTTTMVKLPPSVQDESNPMTLESAILLAADQLQQEGGSSGGTRNPMEWHTALLTFLQSTGLYKKLTIVGRTRLLAIGQELAIAPLLSQKRWIPLVSNNDSGSSDYYYSSHGLATILTQIQHHVLHHAPTSEWTVFLDAVLEQAHVYCEENALSRYHVVILPPKQRQQPQQQGHDQYLWTSSLASLLLVQLQDLQQVTPRICRTALAVYSTKNGNDLLPKVQEMTFQLIRTQLKTDKLAHDLCLEYPYYTGLCQLALDEPNSYDLTPIFVGEVEVGEYWNVKEFATFCLSWFAQRQRYDKVLQYGKILPEEFQTLVDDRAKEYAWVAAMRKGDYATASDALYHNAIDVTRGTTAPKTGTTALDNMEWHLSMAKLTGKLTGRGNNTTKRLIQNKMDLVKVHIALMGRDVPLCSPRELLDTALKRYATTSSMDEQTLYAMMGLVVGCAALDSNMVATVWQTVISSNADIWLAPWEACSSFTRNDLVEDTLFGRVWKQVQEQPVEVHGTMHMEAVQDSVIRKLKLDRKSGLELLRRLHIITTISLEPTNSSIMVAEYGNE